MTDCADIGRALALLSKTFPKDVKEAKSAKPWSTVTSEEHCLQILLSVQVLDKALWGLTSLREPSPKSSP